MACSDSTGLRPQPRTVLFTNALGFDYFAIAYTSPTRDTTFLVTNGTQVCLRLDAATTFGSMELASYNDFGLNLGITFIWPGLSSWTWDGVARNATVAPAC